MTYSNLLNLRKAISRKQEAYVDTRDVVQRDHLREQSFFFGGGGGGRSIGSKGERKGINCQWGGEEGYMYFTEFYRDTTKILPTPSPKR